MVFCHITFCHITFFGGEKTGPAKCKNQRSRIARLGSAGGPCPSDWHSARVRRMRRFIHGGAPQPCGLPLPRCAGILLAALGALASVPWIEHPATARTPPVAGHSWATARPRETPSLGREKRRRFLENLGLLKKMRAASRSEHFATPDTLHRTTRPERLMQCVRRTLAQNCFYMFCAVVVSRPSAD